MQTNDLSIISLIMNASVPVQVIMGILLFLSLYAWAIIFGKYISLQRTKRKIHQFEALFSKGSDLQTLHQGIMTNPEKSGPLAIIFDAGMHEVNKSRTRQLPTHLLIDNVNRTMNAHIQDAVDVLNARLGVLATTGSVSPYIGLLGTVWGIMHSFIGLSSATQSTLSSVAPGIAEALIATAIGLFAAIPAVVAYNLFSQKIELITHDLEHFADDFINTLQRQSS